MDIDEREMEGENHAKDNHHEEQMRNDDDYFYQWTVENLNVQEANDIFDVMLTLAKHCLNYDRGVNDTLDYMKEI